MAPCVGNSGPEPVCTHTAMGPRRTASPAWTPSLRATTTSGHDARKNAIPPRFASAAAASGRARQSSGRLVLGARARRFGDASECYCALSHTRQRAVSSSTGTSDEPHGEQPAVTRSARTAARCGRRHRRRASLTSRSQRHRRSEQWSLAGLLAQIGKGWSHNIRPQPAVNRLGLRNVPGVYPG
jgi:hypothetical protein